MEGFLSNWMSRYDSKTVHYTPQLLAWTNTTVRLSTACREQAGQQAISCTLQHI